MAWHEKGGHGEERLASLQDAVHFGNRICWSPQMLQHCFAVYRVHALVGVGKRMRICYNIHLGKWRNIKINQAAMGPSRASANGEKQTILVFLSK